MESVAEFFQIFDRMTPLVFLVVPSAIAIAIFLLAKKMEKPGMKWISYIFLAVGFILGILANMLLADPLYVQFNLLGSKSEIMYRAMPVLPIITLILIQFFGRKSKADFKSNL